MDRKGLPAELKKLQQVSKEGIRIGSMPLLEQATAELTEYLAARCDRFSTPLAMSANPFTQHVWDVLREIPALEPEPIPKLHVRSIAPPQFARWHVPLVPIK